MSEFLDVLVSDVRHYVFGGGFILACIYLLSRWNIVTIIHYTFPKTPDKKNEDTESSSN